MGMIVRSVALAFAFVWHALQMPTNRTCRCRVGGTVVPYAHGRPGGCALGAITGPEPCICRCNSSWSHQLTRERSGAALIPLAAISTCGAGDRRTDAWRRRQTLQGVSPSPATSARRFLAWC